MEALQAVRGMEDYLGPEAAAYRFVLETVRRTALRSGFEEVVLPVVERTDVFGRNLGENSDIVHKEMYVFSDRKGTSLCLRPEGTAGAVRAFISHGWAQHLPLDLFYSGPMFRYERPQKGRQRQFHQFGVESLGRRDPFVDASCIHLGALALKALGLPAGAYTLYLNSLGNTEERAVFKKALQAYLAPLQNRLSEDSRRRLETNPLRILDSKDEGDQGLLQKAPRLGDFLGAASRTYYEAVKSFLTLRGVAFEENPFLVRGMDYYCDTAFEFVTDRIGAQATLIGGGRYDGLIRQMGGPTTPAVGWACGIERLMLCISPLEPPSHLGLAPLDPAALAPLCRLEAQLRESMDLLEGLDALSMLSPDSLKGSLKAAHKRHMTALLFIGTQELAAAQIQIKNLKTGTQKSFAAAADFSLAHWQAILKENL